MTPQLQWTRQGQKGIDFWLQGSGTGYDLFPARSQYPIKHDISYLGLVAPDGTIFEGFCRCSTIAEQEAVRRSSRSQSW